MGPKHSWVELSLDSSPEAVDAIAEVLRSHGVAGVAVMPPAAPGIEEGVGPAAGPTKIVAYLPVDSAFEERFRSIEEGLWHLQAFELAPISPLASRSVREEDWAYAWKEHFHPLRVGRGLIIRPTWRSVDAGEHDVVISLDPGMAFGTGTHPTTVMMLEAIEDSVSPGCRVLDVGTGSGILAIAAAKLGAAEVMAFDTDEVACRVARENSALNEESSKVTVLLGSIDAAGGAFDLVLANIVASVIIDLSPHFARVLAPGGRLICSGIIDDRAAEVESSLNASAIRVLRRLRSGDWSCFICAAEM